jgi:integrase
MLKLVAPGKRKGNRFWLARGTVAGKEVEFSTREIDKGRAEKRAEEVLAELLRRSALPEPGEVKTFKMAAEAYTAWRSPSMEEVRRINRLIRDLGHLVITEVTVADLVACAGRLYPAHKASSRNRLVIAPGAAIVHYAHELGWCPWLRVRRFKEPKPETRALRTEQMEKLLAAATGIELAMLAFLFGQGMRVTDTLAVTWDRLNLVDGLIWCRIGKTDDWRWKALEDGARAALASLPGDRVEGPVFPWANRWAVYRALEPVEKKAGVKFTPHMARHTLGTRLAQAGVSLKTRMDIMDHADPKSNVRYEMSQIPEQRAALGKIRGRKRKVR